VGKKPGGEGPGAKKVVIGASSKQGGGRVEGAEEGAEKGYSFGLRSSGVGVGKGGIVEGGGQI